MKEWEVVKTTYAGNLGAADLGDDIKIAVIHKYRYGGKNKEKIKEFTNPGRVEHTVSETVLLALEEPSQFRDWHTLKPTDEVVVLRQVSTT